MKIELEIEENEVIKDKVKEIEKILGKKIEEYLENILTLCYNEEEINNDVITNIEIVGDGTIQKYNNEYRKIDKTTDVLSFPMYEREEIWSGECEIFKEMPYPVALGDIVLNIEQIEKQAAEYKTGIIIELSYMVVHSFYHLMGHDHMIEEEKKIMREKEENILSKLG